ncbi:hypothetical protein QWZ06_22945, partial [Chryseobacterium tructae]|uniref:hypothetical protein n=1 Tax=Chryseobacterium tructae TaxID=1037380 RepID=UPI0025B5159C
ALRYHSQINPDTEKHYERKLKHLDKEIKEVESAFPNFRIKTLRKLKNLYSPFPELEKKPLYN